MSTTSRERLEKAVADMRAFADACDAKADGATAEDQARLIEMAREVQAAQKQLEATKTLNDAISFIDDMGAAPEGATKTLGDVARVKPSELTSHGFDANPRGKTLGQLFVESDAYQDFVKKNAGMDGIISKKGITSSPFEVKALVTGASATSAGAAVVNDALGVMADLVPERELTVLDVITRGTTGSDTVEYVRVSGKTNAAAPTAEATSTADGAKPESAMTLAVVTTNVQTIAHWIPLTKRAASDAPQVRTLVENFLLYGLREELEDQILTGSGAGSNFTGILNAGISTVASAGTDLDAIVDAIRTVRVTGRRRPNAVVFHPNDWYSTGFMLAKDSQGRYLIGDPARGPEDLQTLWGLRVVISEGMTENTAVVGDYRQAVLWDREQAAITVTDSHSDFFVRNILVILAEMRAAFGVLDPEAFCSVTGV